MKIFLGVLIILISNLIAFGQSPIPDKRDIFSQEEYDAWTKSLLIENSGIKDTSKTLRQLNISYWNRFIVLSKLMPKKSSRILEYFMNAYNFDRDYFCVEYLDIMHKHFWVKNYRNDYYIYEKPIMEELCRCTLNSYDQDLVNQVKELYDSDQLYRSQLKEKTINELIANGDWEKQLKFDLNNSVEIEKLFYKYGYLDRTLVGYENEDIMFLVVMHSNLELMKLVLPNILKKVKSKKIDARMYAYLFDRICMLEERPQLYGTQYAINGLELYKVKNPEKLNNRRMEYGLPPIDYKATNKR